MTDEQKTEAFIISMACATVELNVSERQAAMVALIIDAVRGKGLDFSIRDSAEIMGIISKNYPDPTPSPDATTKKE